MKQGSKRSWVALERKTHPYKPRVGHPKVFVLENATE
jgi:hypothetical protein